MMDLSAALFGPMGAQMLELSVRRRRATVQSSVPRRGARDGKNLRVWMAGSGGGATSVAAARLDTQRPGKAVSESALSAAGHSHGLGARKEQGRRRRGRPSRAPSAAALVRQARRTRTSTEPLRRGDSFSRPRDFFPRSFPTPELTSDNHFVLSVTDDERRRASCFLPSS